jgi:hypothetical protein
MAELTLLRIAPSQQNAGCYEEAIGSPWLKADG